MADIYRQYQAFVNLVNAIERMRQEYVDLEVEAPKEIYTSGGRRDLLVLRVDITKILQYERERHDRPSNRPEVDGGSG